MTDGPGRPANAMAKRLCSPLGALLLALLLHWADLPEPADTEERDHGQA